MAYFEYTCLHCGGRFEKSYPVAQALPHPISPCCSSVSNRHFTPFQFTEDRTRFYQNPKDGSKHSNALGEDMPDSKKERDRILKQKRIELMTRDDVPAHMRAAAAYGEHVRTGGEALPNAALEEMFSPPKEKAKTVLELLRERAPRLGEIPTDRPIRGRELPDFPTNVNPSAYSAEELVAAHPELAKDFVQ